MPVSFIKGGINPNQRKSKDNLKKDIMNIWILDLLTFCWSKPCLPTYGIDSYYNRLHDQYMINNLVDCIKRETILLSQKKKASNRKGQKELDLLQRKEAMSICTIKKGNRGHLILSSYKSLRKLIELSKQVESKTIKNEILQLMPNGNADSWDAKQTKDYKINLIKLLGLEKNNSVQNESTPTATTSNEDDEDEDEESSGIVPKCRFRGSICSLGTHGLLVFGGRGGGDGDSWWLWNLNWETKYLESGGSKNLFKMSESEGSSDWITSDTSGAESGSESGMESDGGNNRRLRSVSESYDSDGSGW